ncbi:MAG: ribonuclease R [Bdellovibrionales bacterium]|nr:ribonuclease R [Bdellovibrionales bacterium]
MLSTVRHRKKTKQQNQKQEKGGHRSRGGNAFFKKPKRALTGRVQKKPQGFAFIICSDPHQKDAYVNRHEARLLMDGDIIEYKLHRDGKGFCAEILNIVQRSQREILGVFKKTERHPYIETSGGDVFGVIGDFLKIESHQWVLAKIVEYPTQRNPALVSITECLGKELSPKLDNKIAVAKYGIPDVFSEKVLRDAEQSIQWGQEELINPSPQRKDLRSSPFITVDGEDAKDFDDAILVTEGSQGGYTLYVAIADVSFFVRPKTELDYSAFERSTSVYLPGTCIPMLPETLSNDLCSLRPQTDKLTLNAEIHFDRVGNVKSTDFYEGIIRTSRRVTYNQLHAFYENEHKQREIFKDLTTPLTLALELYHKLTEKRKERGVLDFDLPECQMELDDKGVPTTVIRRPRYEAHRLIEEFMIAANSEVAKALRVGKASALYRVHETPEHEKIDEVNSLIRRLGFTQVLKEISPIAFSKILSETIGKKGAQTLHQAILRSQKQARYEPSPKGHFGLALMDYTHFTSPIRRYPDLIVHRALKEFILKLTLSDKFTEGVDFVSLGEKTSERERRAMDAERFVTRRKQCWFMKPKIGETFSGIISGLIGKGLFIQIPEFGTEGFLPIDALGGFYQFDEDHMCFRKRPGHTVLSVGDSMEIQVFAVEVEEGQITFSLFEKK